MNYEVEFHNKDIPCIYLCEKRIPNSKNSFFHLEFFSVNLIRYRREVFHM